MNIEEKRQKLIDTAGDHYSGTELEQYVERLEKSDQAVLREWGLAFGDDEEEPVKSVEERVRLLVAQTYEGDMEEVCSVAVYDELSGEWVSFMEDKDSGPIYMDPEWTPKLMDEFIMIRLHGLTDADMAIGDNDELYTGWDVVDNHKHENVQTIQLRSDRGHLIVTVIIW